MYLFVTVVKFLIRSIEAIAIGFIDYFEILFANFVDLNRITHDIIRKFFVDFTFQL